MIEWLREARPEIIGGLIVAFLLWIFNNKRLFLEFIKKCITSKVIVAVILIAGIYLLYSTVIRQDVKAVKKLPPMSDEVFVARCKFGDTREIEEALTNGANANAKDKDDNTALMLAADGGHTETAELLLKHGAEVNAKNNVGSTALMLAADGGHTETAELLLKHGANVNAKDNNGSTALIIAAWNGNTETVEVLLKHGAEVNAEDNNG